MRERTDIVLFTISKVITAVLGVIILSVETKFFAPEVIGDYSLISGLVSAMVAVFVSWIGSSALRYFEQSKNDIQKYNRTIFWSACLCSVILIFALTAITITIPNMPFSQYFLLAVLLSLSKGGYEIYEKVLRASSDCKVYCVMVVFQSIINLTLIYLLSGLMGRESIVIYLAVITSTFLFDIFAFLSTKSYRGIVKIGVDRNLVGKFWGYGIPLIGVWGISWLLNYSDRYMIKIFYDSADVGIYTTAYSISQSAVGILISSITLAFFPALIRKWNSGGKSAATDYLNQIINYYIIFLIPATVGLCLIGKHIYGTLIDVAYIDGVEVIVWTSIGFFFMGLNNIIYKMWQLQEKTKMVLLLMIISFVINIILNFVCLPFFGYTFAATTTFISYLAIFVIALILTKKHFDIEFSFKTIIRTVLSTTAMSIFIFLSDIYISNIWFLLISIFIAILVYLGVFLLLGGFREECKSIIDFIRRD